MHVHGDPLFYTTAVYYLVTGMHGSRKFCQRGSKRFLFS